MFQALLFFVARQKLFPRHVQRALNVTSFKRNILNSAYAVMAGVPSFIHVKYNIIVPGLSSHKGVLYVRVTLLSATHNTKVHLKRGSII